MNTNNGSRMSQGQARRLERKNAAANAKRVARTERIIGLFVVIVLMVAILGVLGYSIIDTVIKNKEKKELEARLIPVVDDFSKGLNDKGFIDGIDSSAYISVDLDKLKKIEIDYVDVMYSDEALDSEIEGLVSDNSTAEVSYEYNDEFVKNVLKENVTAEEYRENLRKEHEKENTLSWLDNYIVEVVDVKDVPEDYLRTLAGIIKYTNLNNLEYMNQMYEAFGYVQNIYADVYEMYNKTVDEYEEYVLSLAKDTIIKQLAYEIIYDHEGLSISEADYKAFLEENEIKDESLYGKPYINKTIIYDKVMDSLYEKVQINKE